MAILHVVAVLAAVASCFGDVLTFNGDKVYRLIPTTEAQLHGLMALRNTSTLSFQLDWWKYPAAVGREVDVRVIPRFQKMMSRLFRDMGLKTITLIDNVQALLDAQLVGASRVSDPSNFDFSQYHNLADINEWTLSLAEQFPNLVTVFQAGTSYNGNIIYAVKVSTGSTPTKPAFWFDGGIHAREWISPATVIFMLNELLTEYGTDPPTTELLNNIDVYVAPVLNPDGYTFTWTNNRMWRKTRSPQGICFGVDPNRNWDFHWNEGGSSPNPCDDAYMGPEAFSEIEVASVAATIRNITNLNGYINFHSYSQLWMTPWGYSGSYPADYDEQMDLAKAATDALAAVYGTRYQYGSIFHIIYQASGSSADYTYGVSNVVYSYGVELRDTGQYGFLLPPELIVPSGTETVAAIKVALQRVIDNPKKR